MKPAAAHQIDPDDDYDPRTEVEAHWGGDPERLIAAWEEDRAQQRQRIRDLESQLAAAILFRVGDVRVSRRPGYWEVGISPSSPRRKRRHLGSAEKLGDRDAAMARARELAQEVATPLKEPSADA